MSSELSTQVDITTKGENCPNNCGGSGLQLFNEWQNHMNCLNITVRVCPCVRLVVKGQNAAEKKKAG